MEKKKCLYCGQENFPESEICWACYKDLRAPAAPLPIPKETVVPAADPVEAPQVSAWGAAGRLTLVLGLALFYSRWWFVDNYFSPLDHINLAFHEAGHIFLGFFGEFIKTAAGTIFQLLFPAVCGFHLWRRSSRLGWQLCLFWFGENLLNISVYAGDAINQALPLVGGGVHDWTYLLTEMGLIAHTRGTAKTIFAAGSVVIFYSLYSLGRDGLSMLSSRAQAGR